MLTDFCVNNYAKHHNYINWSTSSHEIEIVVELKKKT